MPNDIPPERSGDAYTFASFVWDVLARRTTDFFRRKSEGFGDRRYGNHDRIVLASNPLDKLACFSVIESGYEEVEELLSLA